VKTAPPFTIALVAAHDGKELMADAAVPLGNVLSRWGMADVLVCPWHAIHLADGTVQISGPTMRCVRGDGTPFIADHVRPNALLSFPTADRTPPDRSPEGRAALQRLALHGLTPSPCEPTMTAVVAELLREAACRQVVTNAIDHDAAWGRKDQLEFTLRAHARFTGSPVPRPETYVSSPQQLPVILADFARRDLTCIVKPANGARGDDLHIVRPDSGDWPSAVGDDCLVVQALVEAPLLLRGHKVDFRCYVMIDTADRDAAAGGLRSSPGSRASPMSAVWPTPRSPTAPIGPAPASRRACSPSKTWTACAPPRARRCSMPLTRSLMR